MADLAFVIVMLGLGFAVVISFFAGAKEVFKKRPSGGEITKESRRYSFAAKVMFWVVIGYVLLIPGFALLGYIRRFFLHWF